MKYSKWIGVSACVVLIIACFIPWTYHADIEKNFTGFFSQNDAYGRPGKYLTIFAGLSIILMLRQRVWAQRVLLFVTGIMLAYAIKTYILYTSCYNAYCPEKKAGIFLVLGLSLVIFAISLFPDISVTSAKAKDASN
ncbi:MAG: hypothetical protein H7X88_06250 [Gloeobacteraceae cyanobacterium ES-bin-316]|nr:hypothetical protein [Ferruginibacter sp.]